VVADRLGFGSSLRFDKMLPLGRAALAYLDGYIGKRDPAQALVGEASSEGAADERTEQVAFSHTLPIDGIGRAKAALMAVARYFAVAEPSSPALLLVSQAHHLVGLPFAEIVGLLFPAFSDDARFQFGSGQMFKLGLQRVVSQASSFEFSEPAGEAGDAAGEPYPVPANRGAALSLLNDVATWFRSAQPSSPIPLILDRARQMAEKDFMSVARDLLPPEALGIQS
jgi:type VI secretion system protein ImpA